MEYKELKKLYEFTIDNDTSVTKHGTVPLLETAEMLANDFNVYVEKYIQILDDKKTVTFVFKVGDLTLFERVCRKTDEYNYTPEYKEEN
jgi:hypothetical protein